MSFIIILKFFHFLSLFFAGGIGIGGAVIQSLHAKAGEAPSPLTRKALHILAIMGLMALIVIWLTGIALHHALYEGAFLNHAFTLKLGGAAILLGTSILSNAMLYRASRGGQAAHPTVMRRLTALSRFALIIVIGGAAAAFTI